MKAFFSLLLFVASAVLPQTSFASKRTLDNVTLKWKATTDLKELTTKKLGDIPFKIQIAKFTDGRTVDPKNKIGENKEDEKKGVILPVMTSSDVADFVTTNLKDVLKKAGMDVVESGGDYTLTGEVTEFFVTEIERYQGSLAVKLTLSKGDKPVWKGTVTTENSHFGRSYKEENYMESYSDLVIELATKLAGTSSFRAELK